MTAPRSHQATDWIGLYSVLRPPPTQYRLYGRWFLQVNRPNQQYQSTEGESCKGKQPPKKKTQITYICIDTRNSIQIQHTQINTASPLVYNYMG